MKKLANGEVRLAKNERRIGNFLVKEEPGHMKLTDLGGVMSFRVSKKMPVGVWLYNLYKRKDDSAGDTLKVFVSTVWSTLSVVPDDEYIQLLLTGSRACLERHKEWYGMKWRRVSQQRRFDKKCEKGTNQKQHRRRSP